MEVWILFNEEIESSSSEAFEIRRFMEEGRNMDINVKVFKPEQFDLLVCNDGKDSVLIDGQLMPLPDFLLPRTYVIDTGYFALAVIRQFERLGVKVFNGSQAIETVSDKLHTHQALIQGGLPTPRTMLAKFPVDIDLVESHIGFPIVVKTLLGVNGTGVFLLDDRKSFQDMMSLLSETSPHIQLIFQKFIAKSRGVDLRLFVVDGKVVAAMERRAKDGDFKANFSQGGSVREFIPDETALNMALMTSDILNLQVAGIDLLFAEEGGYTICEANSFPGFRGIESCCNVNIPQEIFKAMQRRLDAASSFEAVSAPPSIQKSIQG